MVLHLNVEESQPTFVAFGLVEPQRAIGNPSLNTVPDQGSGPLAFARVDTSLGLRAAIAGEQSGRIRLALAAALAVLATLSHPRVTKAVRKYVSSVRRLIQRSTMWARRPRGPSDSARADDTTRVGRVLSVPFYPWLIAMAPILHFWANNQFLFGALEVIVPLIAGLGVVSVGVISLRFVLKDWHRPAATMGALITVLFAYGHLESAFERAIEERVLFPIAVVVLAATVSAVVPATHALARRTQFLNLGAAVLLVFPITSLAAGAADSYDWTSTNEAEMSDRLWAHLFPSGLPAASDQRPDIYYLVFDEYARHDTLFGFDNSDFLRDLESRGFYVATEATSNFTLTALSLASTLNMAYIHDLLDKSTNIIEEATARVQKHAVGAILQELGYTYVHLESGIGSTGKAPLADIVVTFTPSGVRIGSGDTEYSRPDSLLVGPFVRELIQTTALRPILGHHLQPIDTERFDWWHPGRTRQMVDFLAQPIESDGLKFVFAHFVKPHLPATFDQYGNSFVGSSADRGFDDDHDPSVPNAYVGQLIHINAKILEVIDAILQEEDEKPIIIVSGDHGVRMGGNSEPHATLAAFHLPYGGEEVLYPSISTVNQFRVVFDFYFGFTLPTLEDREFDYQGDRVSEVRIRGG